MHELASRSLFDAQTKEMERISRLRGWRLFTIQYPIIDVALVSTKNFEIRVRMICDNWNDLPPSIELLSLTGEHLKNIEPNPGGVFNNSQHPTTNRPFICMIGSREYHTHSSHINDSWAKYKDVPGNDLGGILTKIWRAWRKV